MRTHWIKPSNGFIGPPVLVWVQQVWIHLFWNCVLGKNYQFTVSLIIDVTYMSNNHVVWYYRYFCLHLFHTHMYIYDSPAEAFLYFRTLVQVKYLILTIYIIWCPAVKKLKLKKKMLVNTNVQRTWNLRFW